MAVIVRVLIIVCFFSGVLLRADVMDQAELEEVDARVRALLPEMRSGLTIERIKKTPVDGLYEVLLNRGRTLYMSASGDYFLVGDMYEFSSEGIITLPDLARQESRKELMAKVDAASVISFEPNGRTLATVNVFTDVDCTYCQNFIGR